MAGIYLHIPFCSHICYYCDFTKTFIEGQPIDEYVDRLIQEIRMRKNAHRNFPVDSIYVGGGTPTSISSQQWERLLQGINDHYPVADLKEFTVEANPNDCSSEKLQILYDGGVRRLSIGVQSFNDQVLKKIGRTHKAADIYKAVENARKAGFENISIDLIFRLPGQSVADFSDSLDQALSLDLPHYSSYSLILENKTIFYNLMRQGKLKLPTEDEEVEMYEIVMDRMTKAGRHHYEISNYAKLGYESIHNLSYWQNKEYLAMGAGAHGYVEGVRYVNHGPIQHYLSPLRENILPTIHAETLTEAKKIEEELFLGLRTRFGVNRQAFYDKFNRDLDDIYGTVIQDLVKKDYLDDNGKKIYLTRKGIFLGNEIFQEFLAPTLKK